MKEYHVEVFSTYGQLLWESSALENGQPTEGWDGRWKGTLLPQDIYVWKIRAIFTAPLHMAAARGGDCVFVIATRINKNIATRAAGAAAG